MKRKIFLKTSPKAAEGIRRLYAAKGAKVTAVVDPQSGQVNVSVDIPEAGDARAAA